SVIDPGTTSLYIQLGANFIVSPILNKEMAYVCNRRKVLWSPGCGTLSEISEAESLGAEIVKIFPGTAVGGPGFIKGIKGPSPWTSIMPTGGVSPEKDNLKAWFEAGASVVGMGSKLITKDIISSKNYNLLTDKVKNTLELIKEIKSKIE
ncbi:MAG TPA: bifunctional 4-hydroxy-2-oxoglutarate aldolase/2-dehydro-3-deoxy-phosphogluconate aldolase, partial [Bacteroidetes bacterium]|nr:bifunctional 4-hydroxy-2-oxoglutarate aldolase/2-dehydro-3-deoxy-phosphogluconate aldolase [Bacteroidota bacterium]